MKIVAKLSGCVVFVGLAIMLVSCGGGDDDGGGHFIVHTTRRPIHAMALHTVNLHYALKKMLPIFGMIGLLNTIVPRFMVAIVTIALPLAVLMFITQIQLMVLEPARQH